MRAAQSISSIPDMLNRVFSAQGIDDSANPVPAEHDFSEEEIAQNAVKKWRYTLPSQ